MANEHYPKAQQTSAQLGDAARIADARVAPTAPAQVITRIQPTLAERARQLLASQLPADATPSCQQTLWLSFFFDGTGNNLDADFGTEEHSNVARLFRSHKRDNPVFGLYRYYIPGIGTYFQDIGDPGGTPEGLGFGAKGQDRLDWAFKQFDERLRFAEARANNPTNKIAMINVAVFGFSRGATLARAFARDLAQRCQSHGGGWRLNAGQHPIRLYFMGLFDTVASVGAPMSANNPPTSWRAKNWLSVEQAMKNRNVGTSNEMDRIAFGAPGADPSPGVFDGHCGWADGLAIPALVECCVHMVAAHEMRNSFPVDSVLDGMHYPAQCTEMVYPGVHSNVGGGYRLGEGARSRSHGSMLSLVPLRVMHKAAKEAGVPLVDLSGSRTEDEKRDFAIDTEGQQEYATLAALFDHYMSVAGWGGRAIGQMVLSHMRLYYGWRFQRIRQNIAAHTQEQATADETALRQQRPQWQRERAQLAREMEPLKARLVAAEQRLARAEQDWQNEERQQAPSGNPTSQTKQAILEDAKANVEQAKDPCLRLQARYDTLPGNTEELETRLRLYDRQLLVDARTLHARAQGRDDLRPHYRVLLDAYEAEFKHNQGLRDEKILTFFSDYVHDSLACFAQDATLPSDPRVIYIGGDIKLLYAHNQQAPYASDAVSVV